MSTVFRHCQVSVSKGFRCFCPTVFVSVVGGEKIKTPKGGKKKIEFVLRWGQTHSLPSFGLCVGLCDLAMCVL
jgi:hypothetical protein